MCIKIDANRDTEEDLNDVRLDEFWYLGDNPLSNCIKCGNPFPWSYWTSVCPNCTEKYWRSVYEWEHRK